MKQGKLMYKASKAVRLFFFNTSVFATVAIWLSGFNNVHWMMYLLPGFFLFAAITGLCPGMMLTRKLVGEE